ncbi:MAG: HD domain-containing phosphohydrolase [Acidimicrobiia bacterium]
MTSASSPNRVRSAEIVASLCLATDLGMGFPLEHGFRATLIATRLADLMGLGPENKRLAYYACLLTYVGCTSDAHEGSEIFGGHQTDNVIPHLFGSRAELARGVLRALPPPEAHGARRALEIVRRAPRALLSNSTHQRALCEVAEAMSDRLGLPHELSEMFRFLTERWDGKGWLRRAREDEIPLPLRVSELSRDVAFQTMIGGNGHAVETIASRAGRAFDPEIVATFVANAEEVLDSGRPTEDTWNQVLQAEPTPHLGLEGPAIDAALAAMADFSDLLGPSLTGHSSGVARLTERAAEIAGFDDREVAQMRRAAMVHDIGRVSVDPSVWEKPGPLTRDEMEQVRLHPYHSERILAQSPFLADLASAASCHHERLDGSGYHRGMTAKTLDHPARLIAATDTLHALTEPRSYRDPLPSADASGIVVEQANSGLLDPAMVRCAVEALGEPSPEVDNPSGLTDREIEVMSLLARGLQTKQMARRLEISAKTVDTHIQAAYRKIGVSTRAAATLFAMEHGLVGSGEFPMAGRRPRP